MILSQHAAERLTSLRPLQGVDVGPEGLKLISDVIRKKLGIGMTVLMGANIASEVADEKFCETTIGMDCVASCHSPSTFVHTHNLSSSTVV